MVVFRTCVYVCVGAPVRLDRVNRLSMCVLQILEMEIELPFYCTAVRASENFPLSSLDDVDCFPHVYIFVKVFV